MVETLRAAVLQATANGSRGFWSAPRNHMQTHNQHSTGNMQQETFFRLLGLDCRQAAAELISNIWGQQPTTRLLWQSNTWSCSAWFRSLDLPKPVRCLGSLLAPLPTPDCCCSIPRAACSALGRFSPQEAKGTKGISPSELTSKAVTCFKRKDVTAERENDGTGGCLFSRNKTKK